MRIQIVATHEILVGQEIFIEGASPGGDFTAVFEDDGTTGYFYALVSLDQQSIQDVVHIYDVASVKDRAEPSIVKVGWSRDGLKVALLINDFPHAVFDFQTKRGYGRTGFPPSGVREWSRQGHAWSDAALALFV